LRTPPPSLGPVRVFHVIPAVPACPVRPKSGHSANARVCEYSPYGAAENKSLEIKFAPPAPGAALLGTGRSWRGMVPFTHLAREGRMTVTIGRRKLLAALGGAAAWPLPARTQQPAVAAIRVLGSASLSDVTHLVTAFRHGLRESRRRRDHHRCRRGDPAWSRRAAHSGRHVHRSARLHDALEHHGTDKPRRHARRVSGSGRADHPKPSGQ